jgi:hypothetical protein
MTTIWKCLSSNHRLLLLVVLLVHQQRKRLHIVAGTVSVTSSKSSSTLSALAGYYNVSVTPVKTYYHLGDARSYQVADEQKYCKYNIKITSNNSSQAAAVRSYFNKYPPYVLPVFPLQLQNLKDRLLNETFTELSNDYDNYYNYFYYDSMSIPPTHVRDDFTGLPKKWTTIHTLQCIAIDRKDSTVLDTSNVFWLGIRSMDVQLNKNAYISGENIHIKYIMPKGVPEPTVLHGDRIKVFSVKSSYANQPRLFNNASVVADDNDFYNNVVSIDWTTPGLYQLVVYSRYFNTIRCISDVFTVENSDTAEITINQSTLYLGEKVTVTITFNGNKIPETIEISILSDKDDVSKKGFWWGGVPSYYYEWNSSSTVAEFSVPTVRAMPGSYKLRLKTGVIYLGQSDVFIVNSPLVTLHTLEKRQYFQGETVLFDIYNPYVPQLDCTGIFCDESDYYIHKFMIVSTLYPSIEYEKLIDTTNSSTSTIIVPYNVGTYKIILKRFLYTVGYHEMVEELIHAWDVTNSTFTIVPNLAMLSASVNCPYDEDNTVDKFINISLRTLNNIPLYGPYTFELVQSARPLIGPYPYEHVETTELGVVYYSKTVNNNKNKTNKSKHATSSDTNVLNTTLLVKREKHELFFNMLRIRIVIDYSIWALSSPFEYCFEPW